MKKQTLTVLLMTLVTVSLLRAQSAESKMNSANEFGLDLNRSYTGKEVEAILEVVAEEADRAIAESYDEGYKAAALRFKPEAVYLQGINESLKSDSKALEGKLRKTVPAWHVPLWTCAGLLLGYGLRLGTEYIHW